MDDFRKMVRYRNRAEELRAMTDDFADDETRRMLNRLADDYDRMAERLDAQTVTRPLVF